MCGMLLAVPFAFVAWPPSTDLPQHVAQMRLVTETLRGQGDVYALNWLWPNTLVYGIVAAGWVMLPPGLVGRFTLIVLAGMWVTAVFLVAWRRDRALAAAVVASFLVFNHALYWGFLSFLVGWPLFLVWLVAVDADGVKRGSRRDPVRLALLGVLLYYAHALWFLAGLGWLVLGELLRRDRPPTAVLRLAALLPVALMAAARYPQLAALRRAMGFDVGVHWKTSPLYRLQPGAYRAKGFAAHADREEAVAREVERRMPGRRSAAPRAGHEPLR